MFTRKKRVAPTSDMFVSRLVDRDRPHVARSRNFTVKRNDRFQTHPFTPPSPITPSSPLSSPITPPLSSPITPEEEELRILTEEYDRVQQEDAAKQAELAAEYEILQQEDAAKQAELAAEYERLQQKVLTQQARIDTKSNKQLILDKLIKLADREKYLGAKVDEFNKQIMTLKRNNHRFKELVNSSKEIPIIEKNKKISQYNIETQDKIDKATDLKNAYSKEFDIIEKETKETKQMLSNAGSRRRRKIKKHKKSLRLKKHKKSLRLKKH